MTTRQRNLAITGALVGAVAAAAGLAVMSGPGASEASVSFPASAEEGFAFMNAPAFAQLPDYRQQAYRDEVRRLIKAMPREQQAAFFARYHGSREMAQALRAMQVDPLQSAAREYFKTPPEKRPALMDKLIDQMEMFRSLGGLGRSSNSGNPGAPDASPEMRQYMRDRLESQVQEGNPQETARMMEFLKAARQRRLERGLPVP